jgi:protein gp37
VVVLHAGDSFRGGVLALFYGVYPEGVRGAIMNKTKIEWVINQDGSPGYTWNPVTGCKHGCGYCYARVISNRFDKASGFMPVLHKDRLWQSVHRQKKPSTVFVCSMGDLFGEWVPNEWIMRVIRLATIFDKHTFLFLTKNPVNYLSFIFPKNCWIGASTDTASRASESCKDLRYYKNSQTHIEAPIKTFISAEPLLEDIAEHVDYSTLDWIIIGGLNQNGKPVPADRGGTRPEWVMNLITQAFNHNVPVFVKDGLCEAYPTLRKWRELPYLKENNINRRGAESAKKGIGHEHIK